MSDVVENVDQPVEQKEELIEQPVEEEKPEPNKITVPTKKKEKDPRKVAQGKRLAQISEKAKKEKMRREIAEESQLDFSLSYTTLAYLLPPMVVFAGMYLYFSNKQQKQEIVIHEKKTRVKSPKPSPKTEFKSPGKQTKKHVSLFD